MAKTVIRTAIIVMAAIRLPRLYRSRTLKVVTDRMGPLEVLLEVVATVGVVGIPLVWLDSALFSFAEYSLRRGPLVIGVACLVVGLWLLHRSHADLAASWSMTLQVREHHRLVTRGVYRYVRHPMYAAFFLYSLGQMLVSPNWLVGPSALIAFGILFAFRIQPEEALMLETFGADYAAYMTKTKRLVPGVW